MANAVAGAIWLVSEHGGQFFLPEAYGERVSSKWNYLDGIERPFSDRTVLVTVIQFTNA